MKKGKKIIKMENEKKKKKERKKKTENRKISCLAGKKTACF